MRSMGKRVLFTLGIALFVIAALVAMPSVARAANVTWNSKTPPELDASHNGGTVTVTQGAGGTLIIPESVRTLKIVGPGVSFPVFGANINIHGRDATTLTISDLTMTTPDRCIHAITAPFVNTLTLNLTDVTLNGESSTQHPEGKRYLRVMRR